MNQVVTVLSNRLVPGVTLHEVSKGHYDVIDGKQRISSLLSFYIKGDNPQKYPHQHPETSYFGSGNFGY